MVDTAEGTVAVVTGANRGIGLEVCRQLASRGWTVVLGARDEAKGREAARSLGATGGEVIARALDVTDGAGVERLRDWLAERFGRLDVLVNNAGINYDTWQRAATADLAVVQETWDTNVLGPWRTTEILLPLLRRSARGRIVNVSSEAGSLAAMEQGGTPAYRVSKAALNAFTRILAAELRADGRCRRAPPASSGPPPSRTAARRAASSATGAPCAGDGVPIAVAPSREDAGEGRGPRSRRCGPLRSHRGISPPPVSPPRPAPSRSPPAPTRRSPPPSARRAPPARRPFRCGPAPTRRARG